MKLTTLVPCLLVLLLLSQRSEAESKLLKSLLRREWKEYDVAEDCGNTSDCPTPLCVDFISIPGKCCPVCPGGPNCWDESGIEKIPIGQNVIVRNEDMCSVFCRCPGRSVYERDGKETTAYCVSTCYGEYLMY